MLSSQSEPIWEGRQHLGDEPGIYGDAAYSGLALEFPLTLRKTDPAGAETTTLVLRTGDVQTFGGYPGHPVTVTAYQPDPNDPTHSTETVLTTELLTTADDNTKDLALDLTASSRRSSSASGSASTRRCRQAPTTTSWSRSC